MIHRPIPLVADIDLAGEERLRAYLERAEAFSVDTALEAMLPPWLDLKRGTALLAARWAHPFPVPASEIRDHLEGGAGVDPEQTALAENAVAAALALQPESPSRTRLSELLVELGLARAWLSVGDGISWAEYAACRVGTLGGDAGVQVRTAVTALSYLALSGHALLKGLAPARDVDALARSSRNTGRGTDGPFWAAQRIWMILGQAALQPRRELPGMLDLDFTEVVDEGSCSAEAVEGGDLLAIGFSGPGDEALEDWRSRVADICSSAPADRRLQKAGSILAQSPAGLPALRHAADLLGYPWLEANPEPRVGQLRREVICWLALAGDGGGATQAAALALAEGLRRGMEPARAVNWFGRALGYLQVAAATSHWALLDDAEGRGVPRLYSVAQFGGVGIVRRTAKSFESTVGQLTWLPANEQGALTLTELWEEAASVPDQVRDQALASLMTPPTTSVATRPNALVVVRSVPAGSSSQNKDISRDWKALVGTPLPLVPAPADLVTIQRELRAEMPHLGDAIDRMLADVVGQETVALRPTLLVGPPGAGKSHFASRVARALGLPFVVYPAGGVADASLGGTSQAWHTGRPSVPLALIRSSGHANPLVIVDELEKAGRSDQNGRLEDALLQFLEPSTAAMAFDLLLETPVDLSRMNWIAIANDLRPISGPLRDRFRIIQVPEPTPADFPALLPAILQRIAETQHLDPRWIEPLDPVELEAVARAWKPRSVRRLVRLVDAVLSVRQRKMARH